MSSAKEQMHEIAQLSPASTWQVRDGLENQFVLWGLLWLLSEVQLITLASTMDFELGT